ncbi:MAG: hypothetical protein IPP57_28695 [Candidatus Obscuribacter sp.]|nr:hypothetical protein [Candidatus Obscuribacter sp.]
MSFLSQSARLLWTLLENGNPSVNLQWSQTKLIDEGKKQLDFYFVALAQKGSNLLCWGALRQIPHGRYAGQVALTELQLQHYVILYLIRLDTDWTKELTSPSTRRRPGQGITGAAMLTVADQ